MNRTKTLFVIGMATIAIAGNAMAHTTVLKKNTPDDWGSRNELEGSSSSISAFTIPHGCSSPDRILGPSPVRAQSAVWPNGENAIAINQDTGDTVVLANEIDGNAVMSPKPVQDHNIFKKIYVAKGSVPTFFSHGAKTEDVRAFHYKGGKLDVDLLGVVPYRVSYPRFKESSCAAKMRVNIAIANYCTKSSSKDNRADIWIGDLTGKFNDPDVVSVGFWPHVMVVRDLENNPLPESCADGYTLEVTPSDESIDEYLPVRGFWPAHNEEAEDSRES